MIPGVDHTGVGVGALIVKDNKALMLLRTDKCRNNRHMWTIPGGKVELFETLENAVRREAMEETGSILTEIKLLTVSDRTFDGQHWVSILYICSADGAPKNMEPEMHERIEWLDIDALPENVTAPTMDAIAAYKMGKR